MSGRFTLRSEMDANQNLSQHAQAAAEETKLPKLDRIEPLGYVDVSDEQKLAKLRTVLGLAGLGVGYTLMNNPPRDRGYTGGLPVAALMGSHQAIDDLYA